MGVYIFQSRHGPFIKVGHYKGQNAWSRVAHRGFYSCVCPMEIRNRVSLGDLELLAWFPNLDRRVEAMIKKKFREERIYGKSEWFPLYCLEPIRLILDKLGEDQRASCCMETALASKNRL